MAVNADKPLRWKSDVAESVDFYNRWFMEFAPDTFRNTRAETIRQVEAAFEQTAQLTQVTPEALMKNPSILPTLRMATAPPLARDRLIGLAQVRPNLVKSMEERNRLPSSLPANDLERELYKISQVISQLVDRDIVSWLETGHSPTTSERYRAATIVADRLCSAFTNPIIRNAQEQRQLQTLRVWLEQRGYVQVPDTRRPVYPALTPGTFAFRLNVKVMQQSGRSVTVPVDAVVLPRNATEGDLPLLIEAKSAGDFTNTNKRRKEEAVKAAQLRQTYGDRVAFILLLCGYFDTPYLGYEAAEGIDWVWEHRLDDLRELGV